MALLVAHGTPVYARREVSGGVDGLIASSATNSPEQLLDLPAHKYLLSIKRVGELQHKRPAREQKAASAQLDELSSEQRILCSIQKPQCSLDVGVVHIEPIHSLALALGHPYGYSAGCENHGAVKIRFKTTGVYERSSEVCIGRPDAY